MTDKEFLERELKRIEQCIRCANDPQTCGCTETDEDENLMCKKYREVQNENTRGR